MRIADIKSTWLRRTALLIVWPFLVLAYLWPWALTWPFAVAWRMWIAALDAAAEAFLWQLHGDTETMLRRAFRLVWSDKLHTDQAAAMKWAADV